MSAWRHSGATPNRVRDRQAGYTLVELMLAGTLSVGLATTALVLLLDSVAFNREQEGRLRLNAQARTVFSVLADGGVSGSATGTDGTASIPGLRARNAAPTGPLRSNYRLSYQANGLSLAGDTFTTISVTCTGIGEPLPDCTAAGTTQSVQGWLSEDTSLDATNRSVSGRTVETGFRLSDPWLVRRDDASVARSSERYESLFLMHRNEPDG